MAGEEFELTEDQWNELAETDDVVKFWLEEEELGQPAPGCSPAELDAHIDRLLEKGAEIDALVARVTETADLRMRRITEWMETEHAVLLRRRAWLEREARMLAAQVKFPGKTKSRALAFGKIGFRKQVDKLAVVDVDKMVEFAEGTREIPVKRSVLIPDVKQWMKEHPGQSVPGTQVVPGGQDEFFFSPKTGAN